MKYPKPYLSVPDQRALLENRGMVIDDPGKAETYLAKIGYYRLSAYWYRFRQKQGGAVVDAFKPGTEFRSVVELYVFDKRLRLLIMDALERIEIALRTDITLQIGPGDPSAYLDLANFSRNFTSAGRFGKSGHDILIEKVNQEAARSKDAFMEHFRRNYRQYDLPIWIAFELLSFGSLSMAYAGLAHRHQAVIATKYGFPKNKHLITGMHMLTDIRNRCAHHSRLWNRPLVNQLLPFRPCEVPELQHIADYNRLYSALAFIAHMMKTINPNSTWRARLKKLVEDFPRGPHMGVGEAGFQAGWENEALWQ